jgi:hypothetical protein
MYDLTARIASTETQIQQLEKELSRLKFDCQTVTLGGTECR